MTKGNEKHPESNNYMPKTSPTLDVYRNKMEQNKTHFLWIFCDSSQFCKSETRDISPNASRDVY